MKRRFNPQKGRYTPATLGFSGRLTPGDLSGSNRHQSSVSSFFKSAAFPILIVVVLAFFAQKLISPGDARQGARSTRSSSRRSTTTRSSRSTINTKDNTIDVTRS